MDHITDRNPSGRLHKAHQVLRALCMNVRTDASNCCRLIHQAGTKECASSPRTPTPTIHKQHQNSFVGGPMRRQQSLSATEAGCPSTYSPWEGCQDATMCAVRRACQHSTVNDGCNLQCQKQAAYNDPIPLKPIPLTHSPDRCCCCCIKRHA